MAVLGLVSLWLLPERLLRWDLGDAVADQLAAQPTLLDAYRQTVLKVLGGVIVGIGLYLTYRRLQQTDTTNRISEEGQVTERFSRAIEHLGSEKEAIQLGGVYALERIGRDSAKDHAAVMEVLSAFIRDVATEEANTRYEVDDDGNRKAVGPLVRTVIQAAVTVLGRREVRLGEPPINLRGVWLREYDLKGAHFEGADLIGVHFEGANLFRAHLGRALLFRARLDGADLGEANLENARLANACFDAVNLYKMRINGSQLRRAFFSEPVGPSLFVGAQIDGVRFTEGMPDPRTEAWPTFVAEHEARRSGDATA